MKIYLIEEYDSFCEASSTICAFTNEEDAENYKQDLNKEVGLCQSLLDKCRECPYYPGIDEDDGETGLTVDCGFKNVERDNDEVFFCTKPSEIEYEAYKSYSIHTTDLR